jgi:methionine synthase reductase
VLRRGVCTTWLDNLVERPVLRNICKDVRARDLRIAIYKRPSSAFLVPNDLSQPMILVGLGTGIVPFVGFLEHRRHLRKQHHGIIELGETWLFFGCRHADKDFLYETSLQSFIDDGTLRRLVVCFSRQPELSEGRRYVQDGLQYFAQDVLRLLLDENAIMYFCGNLLAMIKEMDEKLLYLLHHYRHLSWDASRLLLKTWIEEKKIIRDVWS